VYSQTRTFLLALPTSNSPIGWLKKYSNALCGRKDKQHDHNPSECDDCELTAVGDASDVRLWLREADFRSLNRRASESSGGRRI
jgi:hypothetical protein